MFYRDSADFICAKSKILNSFHFWNILLCLIINKIGVLTINHFAFRLEIKET